MTDFPTIQVRNTQRAEASAARIAQRGLLPTAVKRRSLANTFIDQTNVEVLGPITFSNGQNLQVTSEITSKVSGDVRIGSVPYMILFAEGADLANLDFIPFDLADPTDYLWQFAVAMPDIEIGDDATLTPSTSSKLTYESVLFNVSGGDKTVFVFASGRYIQGSGSGVSQD